MPADIGSGIPDQKPPRVAPTDGKGMFGGMMGGLQDTVKKVTDPDEMKKHLDNANSAADVAGKVLPLAAAL